MPKIKIVRRDQGLLLMLTGKHRPARSTALRNHEAIREDCDQLFDHLDLIDIPESVVVTLKAIHPKLSDKQREEFYLDHANSDAFCNDLHFDTICDNLHKMLNINIESEPIDVVNDLRTMLIEQNNKILLALSRFPQLTDPA